MRELKFRAWTGEEMHEGVQPLLENPNPTHCMVPELSMIIYEPTRRKRFWYEIEVKSIMQFTGLKDNSGKEIYEGDILKTVNKTVLPNWDGWGMDRPMKDGEKAQTQTDIENYKVYYDEERAEFRMEMTRMHNSRNLYQIMDIEVIGNIYENPELLKGEGYFLADNH